MTKATAFVRPLANAWADGEGVNFNLWIASSIFLRLALFTVGALLITRETVAMETPAAFATSTMLIFLALILDTDIDG